MERRPIPDEAMWDAEPVTEPAAAGEPPRKPPTAVGQEDGWGDDDPAPLPRWHEAMGLDVPLAETSLPPRIVRMLTRAGYRTVGETRNLSDTRLERVGLEVNDRHVLRRWRHEWMDGGRL